MKSKPLIQCPACKGTGKTTLPETMLKTLGLFGHREEHSAPDLAALDNSSSNAMNNRLEALRKLGFLTRYRQGQRYLYQRAKGEPVPVVEDKPVPTKAPKKAKAAAK